MPLAIAPMMLEKLLAWMASNDRSAGGNRRYRLCGLEQPHDDARWPRTHRYEQIVTESRESWHPRKMEIDRNKFFNAIQWLRKEGVLPMGRGKRVEAKKITKAKKSAEIKEIIRWIGLLGCHFQTGTPHA